MRTQTQPQPMVLGSGTSAFPGAGIGRGQDSAPRWRLKWSVGQTGAPQGLNWALQGRGCSQRAPDGCLPRRAPVKASHKLFARRI